MAILRILALFLSLVSFRRTQAVIAAESISIVDKQSSRYDDA
jgi:hypothetical protein